MPSMNGPSVQQLYSSAGPQAPNPDTGLATGARLVDAELAARTHYANPTVPGDAENNNALPTWYNQAPGQPVKYDVPSAMKERMAARSAIRTAAANEQTRNPGQVIRTDPISEDEVNYLQSMKDQAELADFDRYVNSLIDVRKPGQLKMLMSIYPEYVQRRLQQVHTDYQFALRNQLIDSWGINTFDDLHFKYLVDQGKIDGPRLGRSRNLSDDYAPGLLSPFTFKPSGDNRPPQLRAPYASAQDGVRPGAGGGGGAVNQPDTWYLNDESQPLTMGRGTQPLANSMYTPSTSATANARGMAGIFNRAAGPGA